MKIEIPRNAVAVAMDYTGCGQLISAVRFFPEKNIVQPQLQLVTNPTSKKFGQWRQMGVIRTQANAQEFISRKTGQAKRIFIVTPDHRFIQIWDKEDGTVKPEDVQLEEVKNEDPSA